MPTTVSKGLQVPTTGSMAGTWGSDAVNPDFVAIDGMFGGFQTVSLTSGTTTLTVPAAYTATPGAGPTQSQNAMLTFSGTLSGNCTIVFPLPGFYIIENLCVVGAFYIKLQSSSPGNVICAPPGEAVHVFNDGTNMRYVNLGRIGSTLSLTTASVPAWITNCTVPPYLLADGSAFSAVTYPILHALIGQAFLPNLSGRIWANLNLGTGRITTAGCGVDGNSILSAGGVQNQTLLQSALPNVILNVTGNAVPTVGGLPANAIIAGYTAVAAGTGTSTALQSTSVGPLSATVTGSTGSINGAVAQTAVTTMPPIAMGGITLIRAG